MHLASLKLQPVKPARSGWRPLPAQSRCADVKPGQRPTPVPMFLATLERLFRNEVEASVRAENAARYAADATKAAEASRRDAAQGLVDMKTVEAAELTRQAAVTKAVEAREKLEEARDITADAQNALFRSEPEGQRKPRDHLGRAGLPCAAAQDLCRQGREGFQGLLVTGCRHATTGGRKRRIPSCHRRDPQQPDVIGQGSGPQSCGD